jgi:hypothetical protein
VIHPQQPALKTSQLRYPLARLAEWGPENASRVFMMSDSRLAQAHARSSLRAVELLGPGEEELPAIVVRAQEDARCRQAFTRLGYSKVRSEYARHKREGKDTFVALDGEYLWPTMDFVRDWLKEERKRFVARARMTFLVTMLATVIAGLSFLAVVGVLG